MTIIEENNTDQWVVEDIDPIRQAQSVLVLMGADTQTALLNHSRRIRIESLLAQIDETERAIIQARRDHESWLERLTEVAHTVADDRSWCSVFDRGMDAVGLPMRREDVTCHATLQFTDEVDADDISEAVVRYATGEAHPTHEEMELSGTIEITISVEVDADVEVNKGDCGCHLFDRDLILEVTPGWIDDKDFEITSRHCGNCN